MEIYDVVVVGAGIAGSALAFSLGKHGRRVLLIERDLAEPDRIVGELLQPGGCQALDDLGMLDCLDGIDAIPVDGYVVITEEGARATIPYPLPKTRPHPLTNQHYDKCVAGRSFHHGRFVQNLRQACRSVECVTIMEATVSELIECPKTDRVVGVKCYRVTNDVKEYLRCYAKVTIIADGCFSKFRKRCIEPRDVVTCSKFVGYILRDCKLPLSHHGHVILASRSPVLMYQIGVNETRVLVDVQGGLPSGLSMQDYLLDEVLPDLPGCVQSSFETAVRNDRPRCMPNNYLKSSAQLQTAGTIVIGDALNMRHPLTGGGMTVALKDVVLLSRMFEDVPDLSDGVAIQLMEQAFRQRRLSHAATVNVLAQALYALFSATKDHEDMKQLQRACFEYFRLGGSCVSGPVSLLSGIEPKLSVLVYHFFAVALFSVWLAMRSATTPFHLFANFLNGLCVLWKAAWIILPVIQQEYGY